MITESDLKRLYGEKETQERLINNAVDACKRAQTDWAKNFWYNVFSKLCKMYDREDYFRKTIN